MILRITNASFPGAHLLKLEFNDGTQKTVNASTLLDGRVFEPLKDADYFCRGKLDSVCGTVVWPNGADFAPEALYQLAPEFDQAAT